MKKKLLSLVLILFVGELVWVGLDTYFYVKQGICPLSFNGKLICDVDNKINFSGYND